METHRSPQELIGTRRRRSSERRRGERESEIKWKGERKLRAKVESHRVKFELLPCFSPKNPEKACKKPLNLLAFVFQALQVRGVSLSRPLLPPAVPI